LHIKSFLRRALVIGLCAMLMPTSVLASGADPSEADPALPVQAVFGDAPPQISASSAILVDTDGGVLYASDADTRMPMASTTKIMTALTVLSQAEDLEQEVKIPASAVGIEGSSVYLYEGECLTVGQLLSAVLIESANDAAAALAVALAGSVEQFAAQMNVLAGEMGLSDTHFVNPHGLDDAEHYTTARELAKITRAALEYEEFREIVSTYKMEIPLKGGEGVRLLVNHNKLLKSLDGCIGVKTGYTMRSGRCLVSACERDGVTLICVTLAAPDDWNDYRALYDWGFAQVERVTLTEAGEQYAVLPVVGAARPDGSLPADGEIITVAVKNPDALSVTLPRDHAPIRKVTYLSRFLYAPVVRGAYVGRTVYYCGDAVVGWVPLYACGDAALYRKPTLRERIGTLFGIQ